MKNIKIYFLISLFTVLFISGASADNNTGGTKVFSLDECIAEALKTHPMASIYEEKVVQEQTKLRALNTEILPQVDAMASYDRLSFIPMAKQRFIGNSYNDYRADLIITQPVYTGGRMMSLRHSSRYAVEAAEQEYRAARDEIIFGVKSAYYELIFARDILESKKELLAYARMSYDTAVDLHKRTKSPRKEELLRLEVGLNEIRQELISAERALEIAQKDLLNAMGRELNSAIEIQELENVYAGADLTVEITNNPQIQKISNEIKEANELIKTAKSGWYPQMNAYYRYGYEWGSWAEGDTEWIAGAAADFNIWDWGKTRAQVRQAKSYRLELESYEDLLTQQINLELESARLEYSSADQRLKISKLNCDRARESLELYMDRYRKTLATSIELLDAQKAFSQAQINCALVKLELRLGRAKIERVSGKSYDVK